MHTSLAAFRSESLAWMQVAELSFDSFMMRMRTRDLRRMPDKKQQKPRRFLRGFFLIEFGCQS